MLSSIPRQWLIAGAIALLVLVWWLGTSGLVFVGAIMAWAVVGTALLYGAGMTPAADTWPGIGKLIQFIVPSGTIITIDRQRLAQEADNELDSMKEWQPGVEIIQNRLAPIRGKEREKRLLFGAQRAWVGIVSGPPGVGKSEITKSLAKLLFGLHVTKENVKVSIANPLSQLDAGWQRALVQGLDGIALVDNARWLGEKDALSQVTNGEAFLTTINDLAERYPQRLLVLISMTDKEYGQAFGPPAAKEAMQRLTVERFPCAPLSNEALRDLFKNFLAKHDMTLEPSAEGRVLGVLRQQRDYDQDQFTYAYAVQRYADILSSLGCTRVSDKDIGELARILENE